MMKNFIVLGKWEGSVVAQRVAFALFFVLFVWRVADSVPKLTVRNTKCSR